MALMALAAISTNSLNTGVTVDLKSDGSAIVTHKVTVHEMTEFIEIKLLGEPEEIVAYSESEVYSTEVYNNVSGWFAKVLYPDASFTLTYATVSIANYSEGFWTVTFSSEEEVEVKLPPNVVPVSVPEEVLDIDLEDDRYVLWLPPGTYTVEYVVLVELPSVEEEGGTTNLLCSAMYLAIGAVAGLSIYVVIKLLRRRRLLPELDDTDKAILDLIRRRGPLSIGEIADQLSLPRSTAHRKVSKLARYGLIKLERVGSRLVAKE
ncbi:MAG: hypothetical protein DRJ98_02010 [Thermoprotei archaeon]|nr:MAG: hypothetical protein DRJ98_02010 [Thermoprotei archaeon]